MIWLVLVLALLATPAAADPVSTLIIGALGGSAALGVVGVALVKIGVGLAASRVANVLFGPKASPGVGDPGIRTQSTTSGGINSQSLILGRYMTAGNLAAPRMSHGRDGDTPNAYRTHVYDLCDMPISALYGVMIDDEMIDISSMSPSGDGYGLTPNGGPYQDAFWLDVSNDRNTANPILMDKYASRAERPWSADMIGRGLAYVVATFRYDREIYQSDPRLSFVVDGIRLYDPRRDSSVGGSGTQRYGEPGTHAFSRNPVVMVYNILRGIRVTDQLTYGLNVAAADLPLDVWAAAMNKAEAGEFQAGYEIRLADDEPLDIIDELLKTCDADIADVGGTWLIRVGGASLPIAFITDDDILRSKPQDLEPFPSLTETYNGVAVTFVSPATKWQPKEAPPRYDGAAEAADGRRLVADVSLPAVTSMTQAQRLSRAWLLDARRMRRHTITLGPEGLMINPLDTISWSSTRNGYVTKWFEVNQRGIDTTGLCCTLSLRERDPADYDWQADFEIPTTAPSTAITVPAPQVLPNFALSPYAIFDASGQRRPALLMTWTGDLPDVEAIRWVVRVKGNGKVVAQGSTHDVDAQELAVSTGILPQVEYEARARMVTNRPTAWTPWISVIAPNIRLTGADIAPNSLTATEIAVDVLNQIAAAEAAGEAAQADVLAAVADAEANFEAVRAEADLIRTDVTTITSRVGNTEAAITTEQGARADGDSALSSRLDTVSAKAGANEAAISSEATARANADNTIAGTVTTLSARLTNDYMPAATINSTFLTEAETNSAIATAKTQLTASINGVSAEVDDLSAAYATTDGKVRAFKGLYVTTTDINGVTRIAGLKLTSYANPDGSGGTLLQLLGDNVIVERTLSANRLATKTITALSGVIGDLAVDTLQVAGNAITETVLSQTKSTFEVFASTGWNVMRTAAITRYGGAPNVLTGTFTMAERMNQSLRAIPFNIRFIRGSTVVYKATGVQRGVLNGAGNYDIYGETFVFISTETDQTAGVATYQMQIDPATVSFFVTQAALMVEQVKK